MKFQIRFKEKKYFYYTKEVNVLKHEACGKSLEIFVRSCCLKCFLKNIRMLQS